MARPRVPPVYAFVSDRCGQSTSIGFIIIIGITVVSTGLVVGLGAQALGDMRDSTGVSQASHSLARFDAEAARVALGVTPGRSLTLSGGRDGEYSVDNDTGWIRIEHHNYTDGETEVVYNGTLGEVTYVDDNTTVAYQGGGVWKHVDNGTTMVSPPEFHYRGETLVFPVIRVTSEDSATGQTDVFISEAGDSTRIFPNSTGGTANGNGAPYDVTDEQYDNPVENGTVVVTVHSEYYQGWATYFRTRTDGAVSVDHANQTVSAELVVDAVVGEFDMSNAMDSDGLQVDGMQTGHSVTAFNSTFEKESGTGTFNNMYFSFHAQEGVHRVEFVVHIPGGTNCKDGDVNPGRTVEAYVFYENTDSGERHEWANTSVSAESGPIRLVCGSGSGNGNGNGNGNTGGSANTRLVVNFSGTTPLTYTDASVQTSGTFYDWKQGSPDSEVRFEHSTDAEPFNVTLTPETTNTTDVLVRHYMALLAPSFDLYAQTGTGNRPHVDVGESQGTLSYETTEGGRVITFLHVTENEIDVEFR